ncbi:hypothetical protein [Bradyrhizobium sp. AZCC 1708]|uniref:hypothetical protein n=1 Tax=Bradyrhizobium sp. AZCC 1708 TaxID=3117015 RepID=UPI002FF1A91D
MAGILFVVPVAAGFYAPEIDLLAIQVWASLPGAGLEIVAYSVGRRWRFPAPRK